MAQLLGKYSLPGGEILLARNDANSVVGVIAFRPYEDSICEIKHLFVLPQARGHSLDKRLICQIISLAIDANYKHAILNTAGFMHAAQKLYEQFGFTNIPAYYCNSVPNIRSMCADLSEINLEHLGSILKLKIGGNIISDLE